MDIQQILWELTQKFGASSFDTAEVTSVLKGLDLNKLSFSQIAAKLSNEGLIDLDGDGVKEPLIDEIKGEAAKLFGGIFGKK